MDWPQADFLGENTEHAQALAGEAAGDAQQVFSAARRAADTVETVVGAASLAFNYWHVSRRRRRLVDTPTAAASRRRRG